MSAGAGQHNRSYFPTREGAYKYAVRVAKRKTPNTSISIRKSSSVNPRRRNTPWIVSIDQH